MPMLKALKTEAAGCTRSPLAGFVTAGPSEMLKQLFQLWLPSRFLQMESLIITLFKDMEPGSWAHESVVKL